LGGGRSRAVTDAVESVAGGAASFIDAQHPGRRGVALITPSRDPARLVFVQEQDMLAIENAAYTIHEARRDGRWAAFLGAELAAWLGVQHDALGADPGSAAPEVLAQGKTPDRRSTLRAFVERLMTEGGFVRWHHDPRTSHESSHYTLIGRGGALFLSLRVENHDVMSPYDDSRNFDNRPVTAETAASMLDQHGFEPD